jgi:hypothetical protein
MRNLLKIFPILFIIISFLLINSSSIEAGCGSACANNGQCGGACPACCGDSYYCLLGCRDCAQIPGGFGSNGCHLGTTPTNYCIWTGASCDNPVTVPEIPKFLFVSIIFILCIVGFFRGGAFFHRNKFIQTTLVMTLISLYYLFCRFLLREVFLIKIGWFLGLTDFDFILPAFVGGFLYISILQKGSELRVEFQKNTFLIHLFVLISFIASCASYHFYDLKIYKLVIILGLTTILTFIPVFIPISFFVKNTYAYTFFPILGIIFTMCFDDFLMRAIFPFIGESIASTSCKLIQPFVDEFLICDFEHLSSLRLWHPRFSVIISHQCAGLSGIMLFLFSSLFFRLKSKSKNSFLFWVASFLVGESIMIFFINPLRITLLFLVGLKLVESFGYPNGKYVLEMLFHSHLGWLLYGVFIYVYWKVFIPLISFERLKTLQPQEV